MAKYGVKATRKDLTKSCLVKLIREAVEARSLEGCIGLHNLRELS